MACPAGRNVSPHQDAGAIEFAFVMHDNEITCQFLIKFLSHLLSPLLLVHQPWKRNKTTLDNLTLCLFVSATCMTFRSNRCYLVVDVLNATNEEMELKYSANKSILIESKETCRIPIEIERCSLKKDQEPGSALSAASLAAKCKSHLIQQVNLEYSISTSCKEITGRASIDAIPWTQMMLETILMSPVEWQVAANGNLLPADKPEINCSVGETVSFSFSLCNHSDQPIMYLSLWIEQYQEQSNGIKNYDVDSKIMLEGKDKIYVEEVRVMLCASMPFDDLVPLSLPSHRSKQERG